MDWDVQRREMVDLLAVRYGIADARVLDAMRHVPRHLYIPPDCLDGDAYGDHPLPIGYGQTVSQPFIVAYMTQLLRLVGGERVLEVGSGCGYQSAVLAAVGATVYGVERVPELVKHARRVLQQQGVGGVNIRLGDGYEGWHEHAPYDAILAGCAPPKLPAHLLAQLKDGGRMVMPVGDVTQRLMVLQRCGDQCEVSDDLAVRFVPMVPGVG
jgi:protein-L-isoaspartate(D-aspartate) O-methyltransferase